MIDVWVRKAKEKEKYAFVNTDAIELLEELAEGVTRIVLRSGSSFSIHEDMEGFVSRVDGNKRLKHDEE